MKLTSSADQCDYAGLEADDDGGPLVIIDIHPRLQTANSSAQAGFVGSSSSSNNGSTAAAAASASGILARPTARRLRTALTAGASTSAATYSSLAVRKQALSQQQQQYQSSAASSSSRNTLSSPSKSVAAAASSRKGKEREVTVEQRQQPSEQQQQHVEHHRRRRRSSSGSCSPTPEPASFEQHEAGSLTDRLTSKSYFDADARHWRASFRQAKLLPDGTSLNRCEWREKEGSMYKEPDVCSMTFDTGEALARHVMSKHVRHAERNNGKIMCRWGTCRNRSYVPEGMREHAIRHMAHVAFCCPFEACDVGTSAASLPTTFEQQQKHIKEQHQQKNKPGAPPRRDKLRPLAARPVVPSFASLANNTYMQHISANAHALEQAKPEIWWDVTGNSHLSASTAPAIPDHRLTVAATTRKLPRRSKALAQVLPLPPSDDRHEAQAPGGTGAGHGKPWSAALRGLESREPIAKPIDVFAHPRPRAMLDFEFAVARPEAMLVSANVVSAAPTKVDEKQTQEQQQQQTKVTKVATLDLRKLREACPSQGLMSAVREWLLTVPIEAFSPPPPLTSRASAASAVPHAQRSEVASAAGSPAPRRADDVALPANRSAPLRFGKPSAANATLARYMNKSAAEPSRAVAELPRPRAAQVQDQQSSRFDELGFVEISSREAARDARRSDARSRDEPGRRAADANERQPVPRLAVTHESAWRSRDRAAPQAPAPNVPQHVRPATNIVADKSRNLVNKDAGSASEDSDGGAPAQKKARIMRWVQVVQLRESRDVAESGLRIPFARGGGGERLEPSSGERDESGSTSSGNPVFQFQSHSSFRPANTQTPVTSPSTSIPALSRDRPSCS